MIPSVYFDESFCLENPHTFDVVSEHAEVIRRPPSTIGDRDTFTNSIANNSSAQPARQALTTNTILQEKLSWYMDTIEIHLISSISQASASFFAAIDSLRGLQAEVADSAAKIQKLRGHLACIGKSMGVYGPEIELVNSGQLETALQYISYVEQLASGTLDLKIGVELRLIPPNSFTRLTDLRRLHVLGESLQGINRLRLRIGKGYEARLLQALLGDLRRHVSSVTPRDTLARWTDTAKRAHVPPSRPTSMTATENLRNELIPILHGLGQSQYLGAASTTFREAVIREVKSLIRQPLASSNNDNNEPILFAPIRTSSSRLTQQGKSTILSRNLRALSPEEALFVKVYCRLGETLRRLSVQIKILLDITSSITRAPEKALSPGPSVGCNPPEEMTQPLDISSLLVQAVDKIESEMTKVLRVRTEQTVHLGLVNFLRYFKLNRLFMNQCEVISGHSGAAIRGAVNDQIHDFISLLHKVQMEKLAQKMDSEKWEPINFRPQDALILARVVQSMTVDPPAWHAYADVSITGLEKCEQDLHTDSSIPAEPTNAVASNKKEPALATIEGERFMLVDSVVFALRGIEQYLILLVSIPGMTNEISMVLADYLKLYNSRTEELILGAGARITAGLTNINTKHLALTSQEMEKIKWDDEVEAQRTVSPYIETLTKEALTLERVLGKYLPTSSMELILNQVFESYREQWSKAFEDAVILTEAGKSRLLRDVELLQAKLDKIDGSKELGAHKINIVKAKQISSGPESSRSEPSG
ncbi:hypothetical protein TESG_00125 [Trichophyton tonsurans CBS 112818]|uniref:Vacuolar protein sorting-associated protein 54 C-terminal domain-containing protein n=1 Tax=Trichophyton tonsurans (strain CBS 112818) TaxID=647933 RepID=F2RMK3_TRIT1|nr:hypothetical protein TESG_00125 [Trichophyton tonsurans CBS 112818]